MLWWPILQSGERALSASYVFFEQQLSFWSLIQHGNYRAFSNFHTECGSCVCSRCGVCGTGTTHQFQALLMSVFVKHVDASEKIELSYQCF